MPTFPNPYHFSVVLPEATPAAFDLLRTCFAEAERNPGHEPEE